jgi:hypothetical protein
MTQPLVFLLEDLSMKYFLEEFFKKFFPKLSNGQDYHPIPHEGFTDLKHSIPRKLRSWKKGAQFIILRDNDGDNSSQTTDLCLKRKQELAKICEESGHPNALIRIACQELEAWYLGDLTTVAKVYQKDINKLKRTIGSQKLKSPDSYPDPKKILEKLIPEFQATQAARKLGGPISLNRSENTSISFQVFVRGVLKLAQQSGLPVETNLSENSN